MIVIAIETPIFMFIVISGIITRFVTAKKMLDVIKKICSDAVFQIAVYQKNELFQTKMMHSLLTIGQFFL